MFIINTYLFQLVVNKLHFKSNKLFPFFIVRQLQKINIPHKGLRVGLPLHR
ncbi:hypothetical protein THIOM_005336 [Candidatus Thiomargarita nelsonii]|uniref:Uncharacterized protein n=1 Tax=Candidatus Thiomargarita nelsonii TaxID=1003181 RepID=A0A176RTI9_9GAMM|nr:hypothetical protein THIOM_005336 [Candidatus Thiomargarita nelsonii]